METTNQKTVVLEEDGFELENNLEFEDSDLEICGEVEPPKPPKKKKEIRLDEIKPGQWVRTYTIKHLLQRGVLTFSKWDPACPFIPKRGLDFDRNIVKEDPGFVEAMRSCFGKKLEVLEVSEMLNCVVVEDPENRNYKWHLPLECVRYHYKRFRK